MRVLFCGGRDFADKDAITKAFDAVMPSFVVTGGASGADALADKEAERRGIPRAIFPANWKGEKNKAGPIRNGRMLSYMNPDLVVAFPRGGGTADIELGQAISAYRL